MKPAGSHYVLHLEKKTLENSAIVLTDEVHNYLGHELVLNNCDLTLRLTSRALTIVDVRFVNCRIRTTKRLVGFQMWCGAVITGCKFTGQYRGNDFGNWPDQHHRGAIENSDFSDAILDGCRFFGCNIDSLKFPKWPCFVISHPHSRKTDFQSFSWPKTLQVWAEVMTQSPDNVSATVDFAPRLAKQFGSTEDELRESLIKFGGVRM